MHFSQCVLLPSLDVGGGIPNFTSIQALTYAVKKLFEHAKPYFEGLDDLKSRQQAEYSEIEIVSSMDEDYLFDAEIDLSEVHSHRHAMNEKKNLFFTPRPYAMPNTSY